jgi:hypothetical protein
MLSLLLVREMALPDRHSGNALRLSILRLTTSSSWSDSEKKLKKEMSSVTRIATSWIRKWNKSSWKEKEQAPRSPLLLWRPHLREEEENQVRVEAQREEDPSLAEEESQQERDPVEESQWHKRVREERLVAERLEVEKDHLRWRRRLALTRLKDLRKLNKRKPQRERLITRKLQWTNQRTQEVVRKARKVRKKVVKARALIKARVKVARKVERLEVDKWRSKLKREMRMRITKMIMRISKKTKTRCQATRVDHQWEATRDNLDQRESLVRAQALQTRESLLKVEEVLQEERVQWKARLQSSQRTSRRAVKAEAERVAPKASEQQFIKLEYQYDSMKIKIWLIINWHNYWLYFP